MMNYALRIISILLYFVVVIILLIFPGFLASDTGIWGRFALLIPVFWFIHILISMAGLTYHQSFDKEHIVKGDAVQYSLNVENNFPVHLSQTFIQFVPLLKKSIISETPRSLSLAPLEKYHFQKTIQCPHRGIYRIGLERMYITDPFGFLRMPLPIWHRSFYVLPRMLELKDEYKLFQGYLPGGTTALRSGTEGIFSHFRPYRSSESLKNLSWKIWAAKDQMVVNEYDEENSFSISVFLDTSLGHSEITSMENSTNDNQLRNYLEEEDLLIETATAVISKLQSSTANIELVYYDKEIVIRSIRNEDDLHSFRRDSIDISFDANVPFSQVYSEAMRTAQTGNTAVLITNNVSGGVLDLLSMNKHSARHIILLYCIPDEGISVSEKEYLSHISGPNSTLLFTAVEGNGIKLME